LGRRSKRLLEAGASGSDRPGGIVTRGESAERITPEVTRGRTGARSSENEHSTAAKHIFDDLGSVQQWRVYEPTPPRMDRVRARALKITLAMEQSMPFDFPADPYI